MVSEHTARVVGPGGQVGVVRVPWAAREGRVAVELEGGRQVEVPEGALLSAGDGSYRLAEGWDKAGVVTVVPVVEERVEVGTRVREGGVRVQSRVEAVEREVPTRRVVEEVRVERVPGRQELLEALPEVRHEGDTTIVPVVEEVLVKRYRVVEEVRVTKTRQERNETQRVTLRHNEVTVEPLGDQETARGAARGMEAGYEGGEMPAGRSGGDVAREKPGT